VNDIPLSLGDENVEVPAQDGESLVLTLDENVQRESEKALKDIYEEYQGGIRHASVVVMNPQNGQVYSMANYPTFNPQEYYKVTDGSLFTNTPTDSPYEPASICKTFTYATAIDQGRIRPDDTYVNTGHTQVEDITIQNAGGSMRQLGSITFQTALNYSLNTGSVEVLRRIGNNSIDEGARWTLYNYLTDNFSLGKATGVGLYEAPGTIISPAEQEGNAVRYSNMSFGQGMNLTMVQVAAGFSSLINGGDYYTPTVVAGKYEDGKIIREEQKPSVRKTISSGTSTEMRKMLREVRGENGGKDDLPGYRVGVKTGTAETINPKTGQYWSGKTNVGALGFGGENSDSALPSYVIMIRLDGETLLWGSLDAIPVFTELSNYMLRYLRIEPK
jgi:cell division protein FtsI/penicillin-binding protein 2